LQNSATFGIGLNSYYGGNRAGLTPNIHCDFWAVLDIVGEIIFPKKSNVRNEVSNHRILTLKGLKGSPNSPNCQKVL
jgi:hypothetical protein